MLLLLCRHPHQTHTLESSTVVASTIVSERAVRRRRVGLWRMGQGILGEGPAAHLISCEGNVADDVLCWVVAMLLQDLLHRQTFTVPAVQQVGGCQQTARQSPAAKKRSLETATQQQPQ
ncbi:MAG: hypothetical protein FRX49_01512 [Trebouxia sp. A1-2]|nr:MAG: hypothetical protein FRX49_01512 [Trebouxia sp. A1-2]